MRNKNVDRGLDVVSTMIDKTVWGLTITLGAVCVLGLGFAGFRDLREKHFRKTASK